jgi:cell wall-associated NlpC family hydrolase
MPQTAAGRVILPGVGKMSQRLTVNKRVADAPTAALTQITQSTKGVGSPSAIKAGDTMTNPYLESLKRNVKSSQSFIDASNNALSYLTAADRKLTGNVSLASKDAAHIGAKGANSINVGGIANVPGVAGQIISYGKQFLGTPYVFGTAGPKNFDCSGFTQYVFKHFGINLPHKAALQAGVGQDVGGIGNAKPGDIVTFYHSDGKVGHVGIYLGNGQFIHAPHTGDVVKISNLKGYNIASVRRLIGG